MTEELKWHITLVIKRQRSNEPSYWQSFPMAVDPDEYVLDAIERVWAFHDRTLTYKHACHHSTCGACGMRINGVEKLTCITSIKSMTHNHGILRVEPLRNFPVLSDLVVDFNRFFQRLEMTGVRQTTKLTASYLPYEKMNVINLDAERLIDCIECGLCISACPSSATSRAYLGPAIYAAFHQKLQSEQAPDILECLDHTSGIWRCHSAYECTEVCPSFVDPAWRIMDMRKLLIRKKLNLFSKKSSRGKN